MHKRAQVCGLQQGTRGEECGRWCTCRPVAGLGGRGQGPTVSREGLTLPVFHSTSPWVRQG